MRPASRARRSRAWPRISPTGWWRPPCGWSIAGLPGAAIYKAINTADSMIGHRTQRYEQFGWAAARLDDLVNLPASRLSALLIIAAAASTPGLRHRRLARGAARRPPPSLAQCRLSGSGDGRRARSRARGSARLWRRQLVEDAVDGRWAPRARRTTDIRAALALYRRADVVLIGIVAALARSSSSRQLEQPVEVDMRRKMRGQPIERFVDQARRRRSPRRRAPSRLSHAARWRSSANRPWM